MGILHRSTQRGVRASLCTCVLGSVILLLHLILLEQIQIQILMLADTLYLRPGPQKVWLPARVWLLNFLWCGRQSGSMAY